MKTLFNFDYTSEPLRNKDGSDSRFSVCYGQNGTIIHTKKNSYTLVQTADVQELGNRFIEKGMEVTGFSHRYGEVIGLNVMLVPRRKTVIGEKEYKAIIVVPNNGGGSGYLTIWETVLVCLNGMTRSTIKHKENSIKIPHNLDYVNSLKLMEEATLSFKQIIYEAEERDKVLDNIGIKDEIELIKHLNKWFYDYELPVTQKTMTFNEFRKMLVDERDKLDSYHRYEQLMRAKDRELDYNLRLGRPLSMYTVYASITNYLSRRRELSKSVEPIELKTIKQEQKVKSFEKILIRTP